jgi:hypothetical protein
VILLLIIMIVATRFSDCWFHGITNCRKGYSTDAVTIHKHVVTKSHAMFESISWVSVRSATLCNGKHGSRIIDCAILHLSFLKPSVHHATLLLLSKASAVHLNVDDMGKCECSVEGDPDTFPHYEKKVQLTI